jgi:hypothetical protein
MSTIDPASYAARARAVAQQHQRNLDRAISGATDPSLTEAQRQFYQNYISRGKYAVSHADTVAGRYDTVAQDMQKLRNVSYLTQQEISSAQQDLQDAAIAVSQEAQFAAANNTQAAAAQANKYNQVLNEFNQDVRTPAPNPRPTPITLPPGTISMTYYDNPPPTLSIIPSPGTRAPPGVGLDPGSKNPNALGSPTFFAPKRVVQGVYYFQVAEKGGVPQYLSIDSTCTSLALSKTPLKWALRKTSPLPATIPGDAFMMYANCRLGQVWLTHTNGSVTFNVLIPTTATLPSYLWVPNGPAPAVTTPAPNPKPFLPPPVTSLPKQFILEFYQTPKTYLKASSTGVSTSSNATVWTPAPNLSGSATFSLNEPSEKVLGLDDSCVSVQLRPKADAVKKQAQFQFQQVSLTKSIEKNASAFVISIQDGCTDKKPRYLIGNSTGKALITNIAPTPKTLDSYTWIVIPSVSFSLLALRLVPKYFSIRPTRLTKELDGVSVYLAPDSKKTLGFALQDGAVPPTWQMLGEGKDGYTGYLGVNNDWFYIKPGTVGMLPPQFVSLDITTCVVPTITVRPNLYFSIGLVKDTIGVLIKATGENLTQCDTSDRYLITDYDTGGGTVKFVTMPPTVETLNKYLWALEEVKKPATPSPQPNVVTASPSPGPAPPPPGPEPPIVVSATPSPQPNVVTDSPSPGPAPPGPAPPAPVPQPNINVNVQQPDLLLYGDGYDEGQFNYGEEDGMTPTPSAVPLLTTTAPLTNTPMVLTSPPAAPQVYVVPDSPAPTVPPKFSWTLPKIAFIVCLICIICLLVYYFFFRKRATAGNAPNATASAGAGGNTIASAPVNTSTTNAGNKNVTGNNVANLPTSTGGQANNSSAFGNTDGGRTATGGSNTNLNTTADNFGNNDYAFGNTNNNNYNNSSNISGLGQPPPR